MARDAAPHSVASICRTVGTFTRLPSLENISDKISFSFMGVTCS